MEELTERVSALHRENALLESALEAARSRDEEVHGPLSACSVLDDTFCAGSVSCAEKAVHISKVLPDTIHVESTWQIFEP